MPVGKRPAKCTLAGPEDRTATHTSQVLRNREHGPGVGGEADRQQSGRRRQAALDLVSSGLGSFCRPRRVALGWIVVAQLNILHARPSVYEGIQPTSRLALRGKPSKRATRTRRSRTEVAAQSQRHAAGPDGQRLQDAPGEHLRRVGGPAADPGRTLAKYAREGLRSKLNC